MLQCGRHPPAEQSTRRERRHRRVARQPRARRRGPEALRRYPRADAPPRPLRRLRLHRRVPRAYRGSRSGCGRRLPSWCSAIAGPIGYPGMPEVGNMGLPPKLLRAGVRDMFRLSDARMSGTAYGTVVLHVCPEAAAGGPLGLVEEGDFDRTRRGGTPPAPRRARRRPSTLAARGWPRRRRTMRDIRTSSRRTCCRPIAAATSGFSSADAPAQIPREYL